MKKTSNYKRFRIICIVLAIAWMIFIFYNSALVATQSSANSGRIVTFFNEVLGLPVTSFIVRKTAHFIEFAILGFLLAGSIGILEASRLALAIGIGWIYAASDEFHQLFVQGRSCEFRDWCIDAAGVLIGALVMVLVLRLVQNKGRL